MKRRARRRGGERTTVTRARRLGGWGGAAAAAAFVMTVAAQAHADPLRTISTPVAPSFTSAGDGQDLSKPWSVPTAHKTLQLDSHGRWGVRLDMEQPSGRSSDWKDVEAGAYLRLTPRLRVQGSVEIGRAHV